MPAWSLIIIIVSSEKIFLRKKKIHNLDSGGAWDAGQGGSYVYCLHLRGSSTRHGS